jgi:hypothetical protein
MPDAAPARAPDGSWLMFSTRPYAKNRTMSWLLRFATADMPVARVARAFLGERLWIVRLKVDRVDGMKAQQTEIKVRSERDANNVVLELLRRMKQGEPTDELVALFEDLGLH